ncbi:MAG TPA: alkaline phosphatase family protein, partial [Thermoanaerobaculia bacterium]|nr:alkaline phosphatase family protein [Thermoanaerobaculia bacterium]
VTAFEIVRMEPDRDALLRFKRAELRRSARGVAGRVAIFAIDGADWDLITELSYDQRLPNLRALIAGGTIGSLQTVQPTVSPLVWTTIATGLPPDRHGILDFIDRDRNLPVDGWSRREPALWDISEAFGRHAMVVNWWTAWPPTSPETFAFDAPVDLQPGAIHPPGPATARARQYTVPPETVGEEQVRRFLNITSSEYQQAVDRGDPRDPVNVFRKVLSKTWSDHRVAINSYAQQQPLLFMMSYEGTDVVNHLFGPYHPPLRDYVSQENYRRYWPAVANYYAEIDRLIGEWMNVLPADTTVMIVSGHGFRWGKERPRTPPAGRSALSDHRNPGVFIAYGNHVLPSRAGRAISAYDIAPTVLAILGLPQSLEMPGSVATWPFRDITPMQSVRVVSYREFMDTRPRVAGGGLSRERYEAALQTIGHLVDPTRPTTAQEEGQLADVRPIPPEQWSAYASQNNLGIELKRQGKNKEAIEAFHRAIEINYSHPVPFLNLAFLLLERQQYAAAEDVLMSAVNRGLPNADQWFADLAAYYRERNMTSRAIALLYKGKQLFPQSYVIAVNLGSALAAASRYTEALPELERALGLRPSSTVALNSLGMFYAKRNDFGRALDFWNRSLAIKPQPEIHKAAEAARSRL